MGEDTGALQSDRDTQASCLLLQSPLLLRKLYNLLLHKHSFPLPHSVHIGFGHIGSVRLLTEIFQLFDRSRDPKRIKIEGLESRKDQLGRSSPRCPLADLYYVLEDDRSLSRETQHTICKPERFHNGQHCPNSKERCALFHFFADNPSSPSGYNTIDLSQDIGYAHLMLFICTPLGETHLMPGCRKCTWRA